MIVGPSPNGFLGLSLNDRTILFLVILLDKTVSQSDKRVFRFGPWLFICGEASRSISRLSLSPPSPSPSAIEHAAFWGTGNSKIDCRDHMVPEVTRLQIAVIAPCGVW